MGWFLPALFSAGASLLGGHLEKNAQKKARRQEAEMNDPVYLRERAEAAGFNPLTFLNSGRSLGPNSAYRPVMGTAIANAGAAFSNAYAENEQVKIQKAELEMQNRRLEHLIQQTTLTPNVPGIYGASERAERTQESAVDPGQKKTRTEETYVTDGGNEIDIPVGPDFDELVVGKIIDHLADRKRVRRETEYNQSGLGEWRNEFFIGPSSRARIEGHTAPPPPYNPALNPPLRGWYGPPGSRTGF